MPEKTALYTRNLIFGIEDSLVSTVGLLSGVAAGGVDKATIFLSGLILIFVEAFSMGVGSFLSEQSAQDFAGADRPINRQTVTAAIIMFFGYFLAGFIPLTPYIVLPILSAFWISIAASLISLFTLGSVSARYFKHRDLFRHGVRMFVMGGVAIAIGVIVGKIVNH